MALTAEQLVFQITANVTGFQDEMNVAASVFNKATSKIEAGFGRMDKRIEESAKANRINMKSLIATATGVLGAREVIQYADAWAKAKNALSSAKVPAEQQAAVLERLYKQSQDYGTALNAQVSLYGQTARAAAGLTDKQEDLFTFTEAVAASLKVDGKSAADASGALLQLGQALRSPIIQAEEFNSLIDGAPALLEAAAKGITRFGGDMGALIAAAKGGSLASKEFFQGVIAGAEDLKARVGESADTFEGAFQRIENALTRYIGQTDDSLGASQRLIAGLNAFANDFDNIADTVLKLAAVISGALVGRAIGGALTTIPLMMLSFRLLSIAATGAASAGSFMAANFANATGAIAGAAAASRAFRFAALGLLAGPIGAIIGVAATAFVAFGDSASDAGDDLDDASTRTSRLTDEMRQMGLISDRATKSIEGTSKALNDLAADELRRKLSVINTELDRMLTERSVTDTFFGDGAETLGDIEARLKSIQSGRTFGDFSETEKAMARQMEDLARKVKTSDVSVKELDDALDKLGSIKVSDGMDDLLASFRAAITQVRGLNELLGRTKTQVDSIGAAPSFRQAEEASMAGLRRGDAILAERDRVAGLTATEADIEKRAKEIADAFEKAGEFISEAGARLRARTEIETEQGKTLVTGNSKAATDRYVDRVIGAESSGDRFAKNPDSTATGLGQFIESTWIDLFKRYFPDRAKGLTDAAILSFRTNADDSKVLIKAFAEENAAVLQGAGLAVTEAALQLSHFLGAGDAAKVLAAAPGTPLAGLISQASINANPTILGGGRTVDDARAYAEGRANSSRVAAGDLTPSEEAQRKQIETRKELKATIDALLGSVSEETKAILLETSLSNKSASERERALTIAKLENELKRDGITIDKEGNGVNAEGVVVIQNLRAAIDSLGQARGVAAAGEQAAIESMRSLENSQQAAIDKMDEFRDGARDVLGGFISDLREGKSASEALGNALASIADKLLDSGLDALIDGLFGQQGKSGGGILSFLPKLLGFSGGGYTGAGGRNQPAGIVHKDEVVFSKDDVRRNGGVGAVEAMRRFGRLPGFADGGVVGPLVSMQAPRLRPGGFGQQSGQHITVGVSADSNGNLMPFVESVVQTKGGQMVQAGIGQYDKKLNQTIGSKIAQNQARN